VGSLYGTARKVAVVAPDAEGLSHAMGDRRDRVESPDGEEANPGLPEILRLVRKILAKDLGDASPAPYFAWIQAAKCSAPDQFGDALPDTVHDACRPYAQAELSLLEPDVLISQGERAKLLLDRSYPTSLVDVTGLLSPANAVGPVPVFDGLTVDWLEAVSMRYLASIRLGNRDAIALFAPHPGEAAQKWRMFEQLHMPICAWLIQEWFARREFP
jgi:hypothetical protein